MEGESWSRGALYKNLILAYSLLCVSKAVIHPGCDCVTFQGTEYSLSGEFTSPNYPNKYRQDEDCLLYTFVAPPGRDMIVEILFIDLDLGELNQYGNCNDGDLLRVYLQQTTPAISDKAKSSTQICGNLTVMSSRALYSKYNVLVLELITDDDDSPHRGFRGLYNFLDSDVFASDGNRQRGTQCTYIIHAGAKKEGKFYSPNYPLNYPSNSNCAWIFKGDWDERVQVTFLKIDLASQGISNYSFSSDNIIQNHNNPNRSCNVLTSHNDVITVYDGDNVIAPVIGRYCGYHAHEEVLSTAKRMMVSFTSNLQFNMPGFSALFKFIKLPAMTTSTYTCDRTINSTYLQSGIISSDAYPNDYKPGSLCTYKFYASPTQRVAIEFIDFDLGGLPSEDGNSCLLRDQLVFRILINAHLTNLKVFCGSTLPPSIMSNGPYLEITFDAQYRNPQARGFKFQYKFITDFGIPSDERVPYLSCVNKYKRTMNVEGEIFSPNYPGLYPRDTVCSYYFDGEGRKVRLNFTHFDVQGQPPLCLEERNSDYVSLSNFFAAEDKKMNSVELARYCVNNNPPDYILNNPIISDSDFFRVTFKSGQAGSGTGFRATYSFLQSEGDANQQIANENKSSSLGATGYNSLIISLLTITLRLYVT